MTWKERIITALDKSFTREDKALSYKYETCALGERVLANRKYGSGVLRSIPLYYTDPDKATLLGRKFHDAVFSGDPVRAGKIYTEIQKLEMKVKP